MSEAKIFEEIAEIVLGVVNNPKYPDLKDIIVNEYHISRRLLTPKYYIRADCSTKFRLDIAICQNVSDKEYNEMHDEIREKKKSFADREDGSLEALIKAHAGSPINRKKK